MDRTSAEELGRRGREIYDRDIRGLVEPRHNNKFLAIDVVTGDYEIDASAIEAMERVRTRNSDRLCYLVRIGHPSAYTFGWSSSRIAL